MPHDPLREQLLDLLDGHGAHMTFEEAVADFPDEAINRHPPNVPYTPWHLVEHLRITQWDILEYVRDPAHRSPPWPVGYWPSPDATTTPAGFERSVASFLADRSALRALAADPSVDLVAPIPHTPGHSLLREVRIAADHNAYHVGEFAILRQVMGTWPRPM
ncbi:MAG TPA: DinB family protein [Candidatus Limnocylindria bacterium]|nr:DinB family protein [Candidatus Limnocylindria bacterium]